MKKGKYVGINKNGEKYWIILKDVEKVPKLLKVEEFWEIVKNQKYFKKIKR